MALKKVMINVEDADPRKRSEIGQTLSKVLATYPSSILAEVSDEQIEALRVLVSHVFSIRAKYGKEEI